MASLSLYPQFESNLMSNRKVIELLLQLKSTKAHGKNYIKVKPHLVAIFCVIVYCQRSQISFYVSEEQVLKVFDLCAAGNMCLLQLDFDC